MFSCIRDEAENAWEARGSDKTPRWEGVYLWGDDLFLLKKPVVLDKGYKTWNYNVENEVGQFQKQFQLLQNGAQK